MLTKKAKYALKALVALAKHGGERPVLISELAHREEIPQKFLELILLELKHHGILQSKKGKGGGYLLAKKPGEITFGRVVRILDGPLAPVPCVSETAYVKCEECADERTCEIRKVMQKVRNSTAEILDNSTLADAVERRPIAKSSKSGKKASRSATEHKKLDVDATLAAKFGKSTAFQVRAKEPFNGGPQLESLVRQYQTPSELFFVRSHGNVPEIETSQYRLQVDGEVERPFSFSLDELKQRFRRVTVDATMACAGNRRDELTAVRPIPGELLWGAEAISHARWTGVALKEVLRSAGLESGAKHAVFTGMDVVEREKRNFGFGASVCVEKAMSPEVVLAWEMNGQPLTPAHGYPLRLVVPGYIGARSVKWLERITLQENPSDNYFQTKAYKLVPPNVDMSRLDWKALPALEDQVLNAVICEVRSENRGAKCELFASGYAIGRGGDPIERVEISIDNGQTWRPAEIKSNVAEWSWSLWTIRVGVPRESKTLMVRAWDAKGDSQPKSAKQIWNQKGYMNNSWHSVKI
ncbi:MAG: Rrf2 family transcriptional regulator [Acidobacteria bacterium]|nr:Rrf2 family transcriptional regulator [Acidobacteriota bacterium]